MSDLKGIPISSLPDAGDIETTDQTILYRDIDGKAYRTSISNLMTDAMKTDLISTIYPVGSIYMSISANNPADLFGGTWQRIEDTFLLASGSSYGAGSSGGSSAVTLSTSNLPSHTHSTPSHSHSIPALSGTAASAGSHSHSVNYASSSVASGSAHARLTGDGTNTNTTIVNSAGSHTHSVTTTASTTGTSSGTSGSTGSGSSFSIMPPYMAVYVWQRTA